MRTWLVNGLLAAGAAAVTVAGLEALAAFRFVDYRQVFNIPDEDPLTSPYNRLDPELLHVRLPDLHVKGTQEGGDIARFFEIPRPETYAFDVRFDRNGFRNSRLYERADIVVLGDSFMEAFLVGQEAVFASALEAMTGRATVNLGQYFYGPQQQRVALERYGLPLKPKVVLWHFFAGNDLTDFLRYEQTRRNWDRIEANSRSFSQRSFVRNAGRVALRLLRRSAAKPEPVAAECPTVDGGRRLSYHSYGDAPLPPRLQQVLPQVGRLLRETNERLAAQGIRLLVAYVPTAFEVLRHVCEFPEAGEHQRWTGSGTASALEDIVREISPDVGFLNYTPALVEAAGKGEMVYFVDDTHWSPSGHHVAARAANAYLRTQYPELFGGNS